MKTLLRTAILLLAALASQARAQQVLEVIPLRHATVEQVLPTLRPLLEPGAAITGDRGQLIVRASPATIADIRLALEAIDRPARRLLVSVRFENEDEVARRALEASGRIGSRGSEVELRAQDSRAASSERVDQRLQVLEGGTAFISLGQSRPLGQRQRIVTPGGVVSQETFVMQDAASGFEVSPRVSGERVSVDILAQAERFSGAGTTGSRVASSASGRLGEWIELGAISASGLEQGAGIASSRGTASAGARRVWVKVEALR